MDRVALWSMGTESETSSYSLLLSVVTVVRVTECVCVRGGTFDFQFQSTS